MDFKSVKSGVDFESRIWISSVGSGCQDLDLDVRNWIWILRTGSGVRKLDYDFQRVQRRVNFESWIWISRMGAGRQGLDLEISTTGSGFHRWYLDFKTGIWITGYGTRCQELDLDFAIWIWISRIWILRLGSQLPSWTCPSRPSRLTGAPVEPSLTCAPVEQPGCRRVRMGFRVLRV